MPRPRATCSVAAELREGVKQIEPNNELEANDGCIAAMDAGREDDLEEQVVGLDEVGAEVANLSHVSRRGGKGTQQWRSMAS